MSKETTYDEHINVFSQDTRHQPSELDLAKIRQLLVELVDLTKESILAVREATQAIRGQRSNFR